jgi:hypothetical protein
VIHGRIKQRILHSLLVVIRDVHISIRHCNDDHRCCVIPESGASVWVEQSARCQLKACVRILREDAIERHSTQPSSDDGTVLFVVKLDRCGFAVGHRSHVHSFVADVWPNFLDKTCGKFLNG